MHRAVMEHPTESVVRALEERMRFGIVDEDWRVGLDELAELGIAGKIEDEVLEIAIVARGEDVADARGHSGREGDDGDTLGARCIGQPVSDGKEDLAHVERARNKLIDLHERAMIRPFLLKPRFEIDRPDDERELLSEL